MASTIHRSTPGSTASWMVVLGAASNIGIRPYDSGGEARHLDGAPAALRERGLIARLQAEDWGDIRPDAYRDFVRPPDGVRNESALVTYSHALADRIQGAIAGRRFVLLLGGDCSIVLGGLLAARRTGAVGLVYIDAHADFCTPRESRTGSAAGMCLAMAVGRGESSLSRLAGVKPLLSASDVVLIGRRDAGDSCGEALTSSPILDLPADHVTDGNVETAAATALERVARPDLAGFWIHVDADVLDPSVMPAVDSPEPNGLSLEGLTRLITRLARHATALGLQVTIYDPALDPDRSCAERLASMLAHVFNPAALRASNGSA